MVIFLQKTFFFCVKCLAVMLKLFIFAPVLSNDSAEIAQLVEHNLAKVGVASSSLVFRSIEMIATNQCPGGGIGRRARFRCVCREACRFESCSGHYIAEIAQLVEHNLAKVRVASSSLVFRSKAARMVESVDTRDLKSLGHCGCAGSSPASSTICFM